MSRLRIRKMLLDGNGRKRNSEMRLAPSNNTLTPSCSKGQKISQAKSFGWEVHAFELANLLPNYFVVDHRDGKCASKWKFYCNLCKDYFESTPNRLKSHPTVYPCSCRFLMKEDIGKLESEVFNACAEIGTIFDGWASEVYYGRSNTFVYLKCAVHGDVKAITVSELTRHKAGMSCCAEKGFKINEEGYFYLSKWPLNGKWFLKFGVTRDLRKRISAQRKKSSLNGVILLSVKFKAGRLAKDLEDLFKANFITQVIDKESFPDGYTETLARDRFLDAVILIQDFIKENEHVSIQYH